MTEVDSTPVSAQAPGPAEPNKGIGICLSGGGYRAMLFHVGALWRLAELGYLGTKDHVGMHGPLGTLQRVSSVSGGSITSAKLALAWADLAVDDPDLPTRFREHLVDPIQVFANKTTVSVLSGIWAALVSTVNKRVVGVYRKRLYGNATLQDFPESPRFIVNATNLQSGALWRFSRNWNRDYRVGEIRNPTDLVASVVGASSAFPPFLSPARFRYSEAQFTTDSGRDRQYPPYTTRPILSDGGVYDNLGLETVFKNCKTLIVSNAGGGFKTKPRIDRDWVRQSYRVMSTIDNQVRSLRKRILLSSLISKNRYGTYFSIRSDITHYPAADKLDCPFENTQELANIQTNLAAKDIDTQRRLINWGYAACDAGMRSWVEDNLPPPIDFPFPNEGV